MNVIRLVCPECDAVHRVKNITLGKLYRCKKCKSGLITMQPAILVCPACGATRPPAHIEVSRLVTCDECEKSPVMEVRIPGVNPNGGLFPADDEGDATGNDENLSAGREEEVSPAAEAPETATPEPENIPEAAPAVAETPGGAKAATKKSPTPATAPAATAPLTHTPPPAAEEDFAELPARKTVAPEAPPAPEPSARREADFSDPAPVAAPVTRQAGTVDTRIIRQMIAEDATAETAAAPAFRPAEYQDRHPAAPALYPDTPEETAYADDTGATVVLNREPENSFEDDYFPQNRPAEKAVFSPAGGYPENGVPPAWAQELSDDFRTLQRHFSGQRQSVFSRPVLAWFLLAALTVLYGWVLSAFSTQKDMLTTLRKELSNVRAEQHQRAERIGELERERQNWLREKAALEQDLRIYYKRFTEKQREINMLNKAYNNRFGGPEVK